MAQLAIEGHPKKGREVIQLLEMLGGVNAFNLEGTEADGFYYIYKDNNKIYHCLYTGTESFIVYTLEEFKRKFPYKVRDKVKAWINGYCSICNIQNMQWDSIVNEIMYKIQDYWYSTINLQPYKEENMEEPKELIIGFTKDDNGDWILNVHKDYEIKEIEGKFKVIKKQPQYPKTYEECCEVLAYEGGATVIGYDAVLLNSFQNLKLCRDAYWKIAGDWKPDWCNENKLKYCIACSFGTIDKTVSIVNGCFLAFPTKEMRDAFYENFRELIEQCKELL